MKHLIVDGIGRLKAAILGPDGRERSRFLLISPEVGSSSPTKIFRRWTYRLRSFQPKAIRSRSSTCRLILSKEPPCKRAFNFVGL